MERDILVRNDQTGQSEPPSKLVTNIPVGQNWNDLFHFDVPTEIFAILGWMESALEFLSINSYDVNWL